MATHSLDDGSGDSLAVGRDRQGVETRTLITHEERDLFGLHFDVDCDVSSTRPLRCVQCASRQAGPTRVSHRRADVADHDGIHRDVVVIFDLAFHVKNRLGKGVSR